MRISSNYQNHPIVQQFLQDFKDAALALLTQQGDTAPFIISDYWAAEMKKLLRAEYPQPYETGPGTELFYRQLPAFAERFNGLGQAVQEAAEREKQEFVDRLVAEKEQAQIACFVSCGYVFEFPGYVLKRVAAALDQALEEEIRTESPTSVEDANKLLDLEDELGSPGSKYFLEYDKGSDCGLCKGEMFSPDWPACPDREKHHKWFLKRDHALGIGGWRNMIRHHWDATGQYQPGQNELAQADYDWRKAYTQRAVAVRVERENRVREAQEKRQAELNAFYAKLDAKLAGMKFKWGELELILPHPHPIEKAVGKYKVRLYGKELQDENGDRSGIFGLRQVGSGRSRSVELTHMPTKLKMDGLLGRDASKQDCLRFIYLMLNTPSLNMDFNFARQEDMTAQTKAGIQKLAKLIRERQLPAQIGLDWRINPIADTDD